MAEKKTFRKVLVPRHAAVTRLTHWVNVLVVLVMLMSGLQIFNAHPALYWGDKSTFRDPWVLMSAVDAGDTSMGVTKVGGMYFETTGLLGLSGKEGMREERGFPAWATIPSYRSLADGRRWHFFFAWLFLANGLIYLTWSLIRGHLTRDLLPTKAQLASRNILHEIVTHARFQFPKGEEARRYNVLQKGAYLAVILVFLPLMLVSGLTMAPGIDPGAHWLVDLLGGRQTARTLHFLSASVIVLFVLVHVVMVVASGPWNNLRSMITGRYAIEVEGDQP